LYFYILHFSHRIIKHVLVYIIHVGVAWLVSCVYGHGSPGLPSSCFFFLSFFLSFFLCFFLSFFFILTHSLTRAADHRIIIMRIVHLGTALFSCVGRGFQRWCVVISRTVPLGLRITRLYRPQVDPFESRDITLKPGYHFLKPGYHVTGSRVETTGRFQAQGQNAFGLYGRSHQGVGHRAVALQVAFERQTLKPFFSLDRC
jgi:hypothetical protein